MNTLSQYKNTLSPNKTSSPTLQQLLLWHTYLCICTENQIRELIQIERKKHHHPRASHTPPLFLPGQFCNLIQLRDKDVCQENRKRTGWAIWGKRAQPLISVDLKTTGNTK